MEVRIAAGGGQLEIMMEEDEVEEKDWPLLLNFIKKGEGCSGGFVLSSRGINISPIDSSS